MVFFKQVLHTCKYFQHKFSQKTCCFSSHFSKNTSDFFGCYFEKTWCFSSKCSTLAKIFNTSFLKKLGVFHTLWSWLCRIVYHTQVSHTHIHFLLRHISLIVYHFIPFHITQHPPVMIRDDFGQVVVHQFVVYFPKWQSHFGEVSISPQNIDKQNSFYMVQKGS